VTPPYKLLLLPLLLVGATAAPRGFDTAVQPFLAKNCYTCHNAKLLTAGLNLEAQRDVEKDRDHWEMLLSKIQSGEMPPPGAARPDAGSLRAATEWLQSEFKRQDKLIKPDPGPVTARRLNRAEYNNTVRDLLGVTFRPADDFPLDDSGYGFDNIGDVLSLSPVLMEKYLSAAEKISRIAIYGEALPKPVFVHYQPRLRRPPPPPSLFEYDQTGLSLPSVLNVLHEFPADAEYLLKITLSGNRPAASDPVTLAVWVDGKQIQQFTIERSDMEGEPRSFRTRITKGEHLMSLSFLNQFEGLPARFEGPNPSKKPDPRRAATGPIPPGTSLAGRVEALDIGGPFDAAPSPSTETLRRILSCGHLDGRHTDACPRKIISDLARRAYRRPVTTQDTDALLALYSKVRGKGDSFDEAIAVAIQYMLVSPDFLFRMGKDSQPRSRAAAHPINQYELASRLSYFLWSTMPDEELFRLAAQGGLRNRATLDAQVRRMLKDTKAEALIDNFAGQWLEIRNMDIVKPDEERFAEFDALLRMSMKRETKLFLSHIIQEDRSVLDLIDGKYSFLNERLARFYGIPGVSGPEFRRVDLAANPERSGVLTHASVLTVSSYATRTSPVLRGKWILDNILNTPPPPPPANVPTLDVAQVGASVSLRVQMEAHRSNPGCASCHARMDPLGFGLENYDAIGAWRAKDGAVTIDASGKLPDGRTFAGPAELKAILMANRDAIANSVTGKLLIYALGRGLERFDKPVVADIVTRAAAADYKFSNIVLGIVHSMPFQKQRGDQTNVRHP